MHQTLATACCARAAAVVAAQWHITLQFSECGTAAPGCSPVNLKKCQGRPDIGGLARLGGMGNQDVAIESGCCRSTGREPVMEQSE